MSSLTLTHSSLIIIMGQSGALDEAYSDIVAEATQIILSLPRNYDVRKDQNCVEIETSPSLRYSHSRSSF